MLIVKAKVGIFFLKGMSQKLSWRRQDIPGGWTKKESLGASRKRLKVQLGRIREGRRATVWGTMVSQREGPLMPG